MLRLTPALAALLLSIHVPPVAAADPAGYAPMGEYVGEGRAIQVAARGLDDFVVLVYKGGLPGAGWDGQEPLEIAADKEEATELVASLKKVERVSPTMGAKAPAGATVLFDAAAPNVDAWKNGQVVDGLLAAGTVTRETYGDHRLHLEFLVPLQPEKFDTYRGNSGVYIQGRYEVQILDSFGDGLEENGCGSIYRIHTPPENLSLPPGVWQTYDIDFVAARYEGEGDTAKKVADARMTVRHNGVTLFDDVAVPKVTNGNLASESPEDGPIFLQDHGDPVVFRNVWVAPLNVAAAARRPVVAAYERFHSAGEDPAAGGHLLISELGCVSCHRADGGWQSIRPWSKTGPVLAALAERTQAGWLSEYLRAPHVAKPGTTMPDVLTAYDEDERGRIADDLAAYLSSTKSFPAGPLPTASDAEGGERIYHEVGCAACHPVLKDGANKPAGSVPLGDLRSKWTSAGLIAFLKNPHETRPSHRMPQFELDDVEFARLAAFLLFDESLAVPRFRVARYDGAWKSLPVFDSLEPDAEGETSELSTGVLGSEGVETFALRFEGTLHIAEYGKCVVQIGCDDGARLLIDGEEVLRHDGIHSYEEVSTTLSLTAGRHDVVIEYFEGGGVERLTAEIRQNWGPWEPLSNYVTLRPDDELPTFAGVGHTRTTTPGNATAGRAYFASLGCVNCHGEGVKGDTVSTTVAGPPMSSVRPRAGCLAPQPAVATPRYEFTDGQRTAIQAALAAGPPGDSPKDRIHRTMASLNCYACHSRDGRGGPTRDRNKLFLTTIQEMGDESRLPPPLDGVGDKLREDWLTRTLDRGQEVRPYMKTAMPAFRLGGHPLGRILAEDLTKSDQITVTTAAELPGPAHARLTAGRTLVGGQALACIKCHSFGKYEATGIQAVNMHRMADRLRVDWFRRYLMDPASLRPGTRMPSSFPGGVSAVKDVYDGQAALQIESVWKFLEMGEDAPVPPGLVPNQIELRPTDRPILYRNFLTGISPRGIAVGFPEKLHYAYDLETAAPRMIWKGAFIDAGKHWRGRGQGTQVPLGDDVLDLKEGTAVVPLYYDVKPNWDDASGVRLVRYTLDDAGVPTFAFRNAKARLGWTDNIRPQADGFARRVELTEGVEAVLSIASGSVRAEGDHWVIDDALHVGVTSSSAPRVVDGRLVVVLTAGAPVEVQLTW